MTVWFLFLNSMLLEMNAVKIEVPPKIDGIIEPLWERSDSAFKFTQVEPEEGREATENTVVYLLYDDDNLYIAFKCYDENPDRMVYWVEPRDHPTGEQVLIILSPFRDRVTGYGFVVNAKGVEGDVYFSYDGRVMDVEWNGVWYSAARITAEGYNIEFKIPFKTIRFDPEIPRWGVNFLRTIGHKQELVAWAPLRRREGIRLSRSGVLKGMKIKSRGLHLELYPVALTKYDKFGEKKFSYAAGADLEWSMTTQSHLSVTVNPDFAQVEADPYKVNLKEYPIFFPEKRPFFTQGAEYFKGDADFFYSRNVGGKRLRGQIVPLPIAWGSKFTGRFGKYEIGVLGVYCPEYEWLKGYNPEPKSLYSVARINRRILQYSDLNILYAAKDWEEGYQRVINLGGAYRRRDFDISITGASSLNKDTAFGYYNKISARWQGRNWNFYGGYMNISDDFEINQIGYVPWKDTVNLNFGIGYSLYEKGVFRALSFGPWGYTGKEYTDPGYGYGFGGNVTPYFKNNWRADFTASYYYSYDEWGIPYNSFLIHSSFQSDRTKPLIINLEGEYYTLYEYPWGELAPQSSGAINLSWNPNPSFSFNFTIYDIIIFDERKKISTHNILPGPRISYAFRKNVYLSAYMHLISTIYSGEKFSPFDPDFYDGAHSGLLISWNFLPKSWIYLAFYQEYGKEFTLEKSVAVFKIKYLFFM